jgi:hypothetical protein
MIAELLTAPLVKKLSANEELRAKPAGGADEASTEGDKKRTLAAAELAFLRHLGKMDEPQRLAILGKLLEKTPVSLAETLANGLSKLQEGYTSSELSEKFTEKFMMGKMSEFHLCDIKAFYDGLEEAVGMPNPDLFESMRREHTKRSDSDIWFTTSNYLCHTSSCIEWYFVVDPARGKEVLKRKSYPSEQAEGLERRKLRNERELDTFDVAISDVNNRLRQHAQRPLRKEEFIASRLYTGPMFQKYNAVLRANAGAAPKWMKDYFQQLCKGNRYTTTIWVLNSAIVKLGKVMKAGKVYRGVSGGCGGYERRFRRPRVPSHRGSRCVSLLHLVPARVSPRSS